jgi:hypothetical protein
MNDRFMAKAPLKKRGGNEKPRFAGRESGAVEKGAGSAKRPAFAKGNSGPRWRGSGARSFLRSAESQRRAAL